MTKLRIYIVFLLTVAVLAASGLYAQEEEEEPRQKVEKDFVEQLIDELASRNRETRLSAVEELSKIKDPRIIKPLVETSLKDPYSQARDAATEVLLPMKDLEIRDILIDSLKNGKTHVQGRAAVVLGQRKERDAREHLEDVLGDSAREWYVRKLAITALGEIGDDRSFTCLERILSDKDGRLRYSALEAINMFDDARTGRITILALNDDDHQVRGLAAQICSNKKIRESVGAIIEAAEKEEEFRPRGMMFDALRKITGERITDDPEAWSKWYRENKSDWR